VSRPEPVRVVILGGGFAGLNAATALERALPRHSGWLWRSIYLSKLPGIDRKVRVALDWTLDLLFEKDLVQFRTDRVREAEPVGIA
jgi:NADH dehydrogenase